MAAEYELSLDDYISIFKRRWHYMLVIFLLVMLAAVVTAIVMPPVYQSTGTILVESQHIPSDLVQATVTSYADERIEVIKQRVMTRDNLYRIIQKYNLYADEIEKETISTLIGKMRESISVDLLSANVGGAKAAKATIAFKVGFEYKKPETAHKVANELVTLFLDENVKARTERATETTEFLTQEVERLKLELENVENRVATYKQAHSNSLPEHMEMYMGMLQRAEAELQEVDREYKSTQEELRYLDVELTAAKANDKSNPETKISQAISELDKAKAELDRALVLYKETHPTVRALKRRVENLEKAAQSPVKQPATESIDVAKDLVVAKIQAQIEAAKARLVSMQEQKRSIQSKMAQLQSQVVQSPQVEKELFGLMRDYENAKSKYEEVKSKQINAKIAENLEQDNKAERFSMLEPPIFPDKPIKPNREKIAALGFFAGIAAAVALVALLEMMDKTVRGTEALMAIIRMRPLVVIPYITTENELKRRKNITRYVLVAFVIALILILLIVHFLFIPLDLLLAKIMARFA
ncbi:MAG TPA: Wzz/FepE/Etk N-terminal domain-containing protein [Methylophilus sp.]|nr:Wzz/FepE/Etk N-terminal domain-containing protein [Methylophilus sp.]